MLWFAITPTETPVPNNPPSESLRDELRAIERPFEMEHRVAVEPSSARSIGHSSSRMSTNPEVASITESQSENETSIPHELHESVALPNPLLRLPNPARSFEEGTTSETGRQDTHSPLSPSTTSRRFSQQISQHGVAAPAASKLESPRPPSPTPVTPPLPSTLPPMGSDRAPAPTKPVRPRRRPTGTVEQDVQSPPACAPLTSQKSKTTHRAAPAVPKKPPAVPKGAHRIEQIAVAASSSSAAIPAPPPLSLERSDGILSHVELVLPDLTDLRRQDAPPSAPPIRYSSSERTSQHDGDPVQGLKGANLLPNGSSRPHPLTPFQKPDQATAPPSESPVSSNSSKEKPSNAQDPPSLPTPDRSSHKTPSFHRAKSTLSPSEVKDTRSITRDGEGALVIPPQTPNSVPSPESSRPLESRPTNLNVAELDGKGLPRAWAPEVPTSGPTVVTAACAFQQMVPMNTSQPTSAENHTSSRDPVPFSRRPSSQPRSRHEAKLGDPVLEENPALLLEDPQRQPRDFRSQPMPHESPTVLSSGTTENFGDLNETFTRSHGAC
ncbi:hypothetical protein AAF712_002854 [Marasmius tenuissimus]|uniref:Uncharacterized protein n=1 Tax=Marasmius tenuissimus TaxID=585030 RepID=A0ABR3A9D5_9AGAR